MFTCRCSQKLRVVSGEAVCSVLGLKNEKWSDVFYFLAKH